MDKIVVGVLMLIGVVVVVGMIIGFPVKWLWNDIIVDLFAFRRISFWEAVELNLLCGFLFKGGSVKSE